MALHGSANSQVARMTVHPAVAIADGGTSRALAANAIDQTDHGKSTRPSVVVTTPLRTTLEVRP